MAFEYEFLDLMPHTISVRHRTTGRNKNGEPNLATAVTYRCRVVGKLMGLRSARQDEQTPIFTIFIGGRVVGATVVALTTEVFTVEDEVTLPDVTTFGDARPIIFTVSRIPDEDGHHHVVLSLGFQYHRQGTVS